MTVPGQVIAGRAEAGVMTATPFVREPKGTSKAIVCGPPAQACALVRASRRDPAPESLVLVTVKVAAASEAHASHRQSRPAAALFIGSPFLVWGGDYSRLKVFTTKTAICPLVAGF